MTRDELEKTVIGYMDSYTTVTLAGAIRDIPWAAAVFYAREGLDLIFFSSPDSRHSRLFSENRRAAAAIHGDYKSWRDIKGLQLEGHVEALSGIVGRARALATYLRRYPFVRDFLSHPGAISSHAVGAASSVALYRFRTASVRYLDNAIGFGKRWTLKVEDGIAVGDVLAE